MLSNELSPETRISLSALAKTQGIHTATVWRWCTKGVKGITLESVAIGGRRFTTSQAFQRFVQATNSASPAAQIPATPHQRQQAIKAAEKALAQAGF